METLEHIPEITQAIDLELLERHAIEARVRLMRGAIYIIAHHKDTPEKESIFREVAADLDDKYYKEEITMKDRQELLALLFSRS